MLHRKSSLHHPHEHPDLMASCQSPEDLSSEFSVKRTMDGEYQGAKKKNKKIKGVVILVNIKTLVGLLCVKMGRAYTEGNARKSLFRFRAKFSLSHVNPPQL